MFLKGFRNLLRHLISVISWIACIVRLLRHYVVLYRQPYTVYLIPYTLYLITNTIKIKNYNSKSIIFAWTRYYIKLYDNPVGDYNKYSVLSRISHRFKLAFTWVHKIRLRNTAKTRRTSKCQTAKTTATLRLVTNHGCQLLRLNPDRLSHATRFELFAYWCKHVIPIVDLGIILQNSKIGETTSHSKMIIFSPSTWRWI